MYLEDFSRERSRAIGVGPELFDIVDGRRERFFERHALLIGFTKLVLEPVARSDRFIELGTGARRVFHLRFELVALRDRSIASDDRFAELCAQTRELASVALGIGTLQLGLLGP